MQSIHHFAEQNGASYCGRWENRSVPQPLPASKAALVRVERLELPRLTAPEPKSGVSTNFTIPAFRKTSWQCLRMTPSGARRLYITRFKPRKGKMTVTRRYTRTKVSKAQ